MGAVFAPTRFSLVRLSVRDLVADGKSLLRNSGVGGGGEKFDPQLTGVNGYHFGVYGRFSAVHRR